MHTARRCTRSPRHIFFSACIHYGMWSVLHMQFNSYLFILAVIPGFVVCYFLLSKIGTIFGKTAIIAFSVLFYAYGGWDSALVLGISLVSNLIFSFLLLKIKRFRKLLLIIAILVNVGLLFYFKYYNFALTTINDLFGASFTLQSIILPLGISFFTFQQVMYAVAIYKAEIQEVNIFDYLCYVLYFPKLIMGPLMEPKDFVDQINNKALKVINWENIACGIKLFGFGLFKKMVLADTFAKGVSWGFSNISAATSGDLFLVTLFYTFEIYFDFSGYSDMAIGVSQMVNISLPINFDSPYKAVSIRDFWKRWHMSLTAFFTKYVYIPLGGSRKGNIRTYANILIVFLVSGLWHGANRTFILWGCIHGILQVFERISDKRLKRQQSPIRFLFTFLVVNLLWLLFRSETISQWVGMLGKMFAFQNMAISEGLINAFALPETAFLFDKFDFLKLNTLVRGLPMLLLTVSAFLICMIPENNYRNMKKIDAINMVLCAAAFVWAFLCLGAESVFVYYNF